MNKENIRRYIMNDLTKSEKNKFNKELQGSESLREEVEKLKLSLKNIDELKPLEDNSEYFNNLLPKVYDRISKSVKRKYYFRYAYSFSIIAIIAVLLSTQFTKRDLFFDDSYIAIMESAESISEDEYLEFLQEEYNSDILFYTELMYEDLNTEILETNADLFIDDYSDGFESIYNRIDEITSDEYEDLKKNIEVIEYF